MIGGRGGRHRPKVQLLPQDLSGRSFCIHAGSGAGVRREYCWIAVRAPEPAGLTLGVYIDMLCYVIHIAYALGPSVRTSLSKLRTGNAFEGVHNLAHTA
eukprot:8738250-Pyramimonas_sp.AAC.1